MLLTMFIRDCGLIACWQGCFVEAEACFVHLSKFAHCYSHR